MGGGEVGKAKMEAKRPIKGILQKSGRETMAAWTRKAAKAVGGRGCIETNCVWQIKSTGPICLGNDGIKEIP